MHFFDLTHASVNDPEKAGRIEPALDDRPSKRLKDEQDGARPHAAAMPQPTVQPNQQKKVRLESSGFAVHVKKTF